MRVRVGGRLSPFFRVLSFLALLLTLSGCLSKKPLSNPGRMGGGYTPRKASSSYVNTDASDLPKRVALESDLLQTYAELIGANQRNLNPALYQTIHEWMGTPYRYGGTGKSGTDCSAFAVMLMQEVYGKDIPRSSRDQAGAVKRKWEKQLREGDLVFFSFGRNIDHVGVYLGNSKFVHVSTKAGVVISNLKDPWYYRYFKRAGSVR